MSLYATLYTINSTDKRVWITVYDLAKTRHLDYGWVDPGKYRTWQSGNYMYGSFYHVRGEVKSDANGSDPNIYDTSIQVNIGAADKAVRVQIPGVIDQMIDTSGSVVQILKGNGNYYWSNLAG